MSFHMLFFFKQKTAYELRISDWSSDVCSSDLAVAGCLCGKQRGRELGDGHAEARRFLDVLQSLVVMGSDGDVALGCHAADRYTIGRRKGARGLGVAVEALPHLVLRHMEQLDENRLRLLCLGKLALADGVIHTRHEL